VHAREELLPEAPVDGKAGEKEDAVGVPAEDVLGGGREFHLPFHFESERALDTAPEGAPHEKAEGPPPQALEGDKIGREVEAGQDKGPTVAVPDQVDKEEDERVKDLDVMHLRGREGWGEGMNDKGTVEHRVLLPWTIMDTGGSNRRDRLRTRRKVMTKSTACVAGWTGVEKSSLAGPRTGATMDESSPVKKERVFEEEKEAQDESVADVRRRCPCPAVPLFPVSRICSVRGSWGGLCRCRMSDLEASSVVAMAPFCPGTAATWLVVECDGARQVDSLALFATSGPFHVLAVVEGEQGSGSISEERMECLSSAKEEELLLVLLPLPFLRRKKAVMCDTVLLCRTAGASQDFAWKRYVKLGCVRPDGGWHVGIICLPKLRVRCRQRCHFWHLTHVLSKQKLLQSSYSPSFPDMGEKERLRR